MTHSLTRKALAASALSLLLLTSCGQPPINKDADPAQVLKDARAHFVTSASALMDKTASGSSKGTFEANLENPDAMAKFNGNIETSVNKQSDLMVAFGLAGDVTTPTTGKISADLTAELRKVAKIIFAKVDKIAVKAEQEALQAQLDQYLAMSSMFTEKWMKFDLVQLAAGSPEDMAAIEQALSSGANIEGIKKALAKLNDKEIFTVQEKLQSEDGMYVYKVVPNKDGVKAFFAAIRTELGTTTPMTPEAEAELDQLLDALSASNVTHKLYIDSEMNYRKFVSTGNIDSTDMKADVTSTFTTDKDLNFKWVVDVKASSATAASETINVAFKAENNNLTSSFELTYDAAFLKTKFTLKGSSNFKAGDVKIEEPAGAVDFAQMMGGSAPTATGTTLPAGNE